MIPILKIKNQRRLIKLLYEIANIPLEIDWKKIIEYQTVCLKSGINKIGIPDLIILDNVIRNNLILYTMDKHFANINKYIKFSKIDS